MDRFSRLLFPPSAKSKEKVETPLTPTPRNHRAVRAEAVHRVDPAVLRRIDLLPARTLRGWRPGDTAAACSSCVAMDCDASEHARSVSWCGLAPGCNDVTGRFWSGNRTRDLGLTVRCSTRLSYPVVDEPDSNRQPTACAAAPPLSFRPLAERLLPIPGMRHGSAARTGRACKPVPLWTVRAMFRIGLSSERPIRVRCIARRPCRSIKARRRSAFAVFPASGQQCPDASGARCNRVVRACGSFANAENETPPGAGTRGRSRCLGRSGRPISAMRKDQSMEVVPW